MTTTAEEAELLRQPLPDRIETVEQAVASLRLDPDPTHREGAFCTGFIEGGCAGICYSLTGFMPSDLAELLVESYATSLAPMPFAAALAARPTPLSLWVDSLGTYTAEALRHIGRLAGFRAEGRDGRDCYECPACGRLNITEVHDVAYCPLDGVWACARGCFESLCTGPRHARECHEDAS